MQWFIKTGKANKKTMNSFHFNIQPKWNIDDYKALDYKLDIHKSQEDNDKYTNAGHFAQSLTLYNYFEPNQMPESMAYIRQCFDFLKNINVAVNLFTPGQYIPIHYDRYGLYKKINNLSQDSNVSRYIVMLEDSEEGQMLYINQKVYSNWQAGQVYGWQNDTPHTFYNLSLKNRYAVQITGQSC